MGHPILGDTKYANNNIRERVSDNSDWRSKNSIALAATAISFKLATEDKTLNLEIPLPEEWSKYLK